MDIKGKVVCDHRVGYPLISYLLDTCPRCRSTGYYGSPVFSLDGKYSTITGSNQLSQQIEKILVENRRSTGYGFDYSLLSGVITNGSISAIKAEIIRCLQYLYNTQRSEKSRGFYYNSNEELSSSPPQVDVTQIANEPRSLRADVTVKSVSGNKSSVTVLLRK